MEIASFHGDESSVQNVFKANVEGVPMEVLGDSGAGASIVSLNFMKERYPDIHKILWEHRV